jgi:hypothetical protein
MTFFKSIIILSHLPILLAVIYSALYYHRFSKELKAFCPFLFLSGLVQFSSLLLWFLKRNNLPLLHFYIPAGFLCLAFFYRTLLSGFIKARIIEGAAILFIIFSLVNTLFIQPLLTFNSNGLVVESVLIVIMALFTFIFLLNDIVKESGTRDIKSLNWINSGLFIFYSSGLLIFYFGNVITHSLSEMLNLYTWVLHSAFSVAMYSCFFIGLWKGSKT